MMILRFAQTALVFLIVSIGSARGDTLTLKDGSEVTGVIVSESSDQIVIDCLVSPGSKDLKKIRMANVESIKKAGEDENSFLQLGDLSSPQTMTDSAIYDMLLETKIPGYIAKYPYSRNVQKLRDIATRCELERKRLLAGDRKIEGIWFTEQQIKNDPFKYEIRQISFQLNNDPIQAEAARQFEEMKEKAQKDDTVGALKTYELLERDYPGSRVLPDAVTLAKQQMEVLQQKTSYEANNLDAYLVRFKTAFANPKSNDANEVADALENECMLAKEAVLQSSKDGTKFFPIFSNIRPVILDLLPQEQASSIYKSLSAAAICNNKQDSSSPINMLKNVLKTEINRISLLPVESMRQSLAYSKEARREVDEGDLAGAKAHLSQAKSSWDKNAEIPLLQKMISCLENERKPEAQQPTPQPQAH